ncbi:MAG TPA: galactokinase [Mycobacteriales bacterium]|nr:galactokinase [Mycobacteriales bacterium]
MTEPARPLVDGFRDRTGREPDGVWAAPGRVNLIGEHTDYNDGFVLPLAIDRVTTVAIGRRRDDVAACWSLTHGEATAYDVTTLAPGDVDGWAAYPLGVAWALRRGGIDVRGFDLVVSSTVPTGSGLSSSAALECATALGLAELFSARTGRRALALAGQRAEAEMAGVPVGVMDQMASMLGRAGHALFLDCRFLDTEQVPLDLAGAGLRLLVIDTKVEHSLAEGAYAERRRACERAAALLGVPALRDVDAGQVEQLPADVRARARHVVTENARVLATVDRLRAGEWSAVGALLGASHRSLRDDYEVSCAELDTAVDAAVGAGAVGARMTGGGFGGSAIALVAGERADAAARAVAAAFAQRGFRAPEVFAVEATDGARRVR